MGTIAGMRVQIATPDGQYRSCKNAVRTPEEFCHSHGGNPTNSFGGKTVAKATAEAERGELFPPSASHWDQAEMRYEKLQGQITSMLREEPGRFAQMWAVCSSRRRQDGTQRFSSGNQMMVLIQHLTNYKEEHPNAGWEEAFNSAYEKVAQPHLTKDAWERNGRAPLDDAQGVVVVHYRPRAWIEREDGETDEEFQERCRKGKGHMVPHIQYPLDQTSGDHYEQPEDPYNVILPQGHGDADAAYETLMDYAASRDYKVVHVDTPLPGGARGSWNPVTSTITIWNGIGDGDMGARLHTLAHEIGHADLGHGSDDDAERVRPDQEAGAESFAYLTTARFGIDSSERANHYIKTWQQNHNIDMAAVSSGAFMSAAKAADQMFLNVPSFNPADEPAPL